MALDTANALVSLAEAKTFLKITAASEDSVIEDFINKASIWANDYTGRRLLLRSNSDSYDGDSSDLLVLNDYPVSSIIDMRINDGSYTGAPPSTTNYTLDSKNGIVKLTNGEIFYTGFRNVTVSYSAGYSPIPESIKEAVLVYVGAIYRRQYADQKFGVSSETIGDRTTTYANEDFTLKAKSLLNPYRCERVKISAI
jgi:uncharacterized phiE125 gp8 family phage protein